MSSIVGTTATLFLLARAPFKERESEIKVIRCARGTISTSTEKKRQRKREGKEKRDLTPIKQKDKQETLRNTADRRGRKRGKLDARKKSQNMGSTYASTQLLLLYV